MRLDFLLSPAACGGGETIDGGGVGVGVCVGVLVPAACCWVITWAPPPVDGGLLNNCAVGKEVYTVSIM